MLPTTYASPSCASVHGWCWMLAVVSSLGTSKRSPTRRSSAAPDNRSRNSRNPPPMTPTTTTVATSERVVCPIPGTSEPSSRPGFRRSVAGRCARSKPQTAMAWRRRLDLSGVRVGPRDDLEDVPARVIEVHAASAVVGVDLALQPVTGVGPVGEAARLDAAEDPVELVLAHEEGVVLRRGLALQDIEVQRHLVPHLDTEEGTERHRLRQPSSRPKPWRVSCRRKLPLPAWWGMGSRSPCGSRSRQGSRTGQRTAALGAVPSDEAEHPAPVWPLRRRAGQ